MAAVSIEHLTKFCVDALLPGEREWSNYRQACETGIVLPADVIEKLQAVASLTGLSSLRYWP